MNKSIQKNASSYIQYANELIIAGKIERAIGIYLNCLGDFPLCIEAYNNISILLNDRLQYKSSIFYIKKGIVCNPYMAELYRTFGIFLLEHGNEEEALRCFYKAIELRPEFDDAYFNLGNVFAGYAKWGRVNYLDAISCYQKAIDLNSKNIAAYSNMARLFLDFKDYISAFKIYSRSILIAPSVLDSYRNIAGIYFLQGDYRKSNKAYQIYFRQNSLVHTWKRNIYINANSSDEKASLAVSPENLPEECIFIPSYTANLKNGLEHLMYLHIPKSGGTRFEVPIIDLITKWYMKNAADKFGAYINQFYQETELRYILFDGRGDQLFYDCAVDHLPNSRDIKFSFYRSYLASSRKIYSKLQSKCGIIPKRIASYRNPEKRLRSAIKHLLRNNGNRVDLVRNDIKNRSLFLDNSIYRTCFDNFDPILKSQEGKEPYVDSLLELGDYSSLTEIQSQFISTCHLPNILIKKYIHESPKSNNKQTDVIDQLVKESIENGFLEFDRSNTIKSLISSEDKELLPIQDNLNANVHPLTLVLSTNTSSYHYNKSIFIPTFMLNTNSGLEIIKKAFD